MLKQSPQMQEYSFMEVLTETEAEELHNSLTNDGWVFNRVGDGWMNNIAIYSRDKT